MPQTSATALSTQLILFVLFSAQMIVAFVPLPNLASSRATRSCWITKSAHVGVSVSPIATLKSQPTPLQHLSERSVDLLWNKPTSEGGFGRVYFGWDHDSSDQVVAKVPLLGNKHAEMSWGLEKYINDKLQERGGIEGPWASYIGALPVHDITHHAEEALLPKALTWKKEGRTLADYLSKRDLPAVLKVQDRHSKIRPVLAERVLGELLLALAKLHRIGIIHRDIKPDNIILCPSSTGKQSGGGVRVKLIDFGSALDLQCWVCPVLQVFMQDLASRGWKQETRTAAYCPPEEKINLRKPVTYDSFEAAMTALRVLCPSLGFDSRGHTRFKHFALNELPQNHFDLDELCDAKATEDDLLALELRELGSGKHDRLKATLSALLREDSGERASEEQALVLLGGDWHQRLQEEKRMA